MRNIKLVLQYDGTNYAGWQVQNNAVTIQDLLEKALARFQVDPGNAYFIGDSERDVEAAHRAGVHPVKVDCNQDLRSLLGRF